MSASPLRGASGVIFSCRPFVRLCVCLSVRDVVSVISPVCTAWIFRKLLLLVHHGTKMNWLGFGVKRSKARVLVQRYTRARCVGHKKRATLLLTITSMFLGGFLVTLLVPMEAGMSTLQRSYKIYNFSLTVSQHYLIKLKPHKTAHFEVITQLQE